MSQEIIAQVILRKTDGTSILENDEPVTAQNIDKYKLEDKEIEEASNELKTLGFKIVGEGPVSLTISGSKDLFEMVFQTTLQENRDMVNDLMESSYYTVLKPLMIPQELSRRIAEILLPSPPQLF